MSPFTVAQMITDGRAEAAKLHELAERADVAVRERVGTGPPRDLTADEQALIDYVKALRDAHGTIMLALDRCPKS